MKNKIFLMFLLLVSFASVNAQKHIAEEHASIEAISLKGKKVTEITDNVDASTNEQSLVTAKAVKNYVSNEANPLGDVRIANPQQDQTLLYNGSYWLNAVPSVPIWQLLGTEIDNPQEGEVLIFREGNWQNETLNTGGNGTSVEVDPIFSTWKGSYNGSATTLNNNIQANSGRITTVETGKLDKGGYGGNAQNLKDEIDQRIKTVNGVGPDSGGNVNVVGGGSSSTVVAGEGIGVINPTTSTQEVSFKASNLQTEDNPVAANLYFITDASGNSRRVSYTKVKELLQDDNNAFMFINKHESIFLYIDTFDDYVCNDIYVALVDEHGDNMNTQVQIADFNVDATGCDAVVHHVTDNRAHLSISHMTNGGAVKITHTPSGAYQDWHCVIWGGPASGGGIGDNAVTLTTANISNNAITKDKIQDGSIVSDKIENGAIITQKIDDGAVVTAKIHNNAITNSKLSNGSITASKLSSDITDRLLSTTGVLEGQTPKWNNATQKWEYVTLACCEPGGGGSETDPVFSSWKGSYSGTAITLSNEIQSNNNNIAELEESKLDKGSYSGTANDLYNLASSNTTTITNINSNKLEKAGYSGTANDLKNDIDALETQMNNLSGQSTTVTEGEGITVVQSTPNTQEVNFDASKLVEETNPVAANTYVVVDASNNSRKVPFSDFEAMIGVQHEYLMINKSESIFMYTDDFDTYICNDVFVKLVDENGNDVPGQIPPTAFNVTATGCTSYVSSIVQNKATLRIKNITNGATVKITHTPSGAYQTWSCIVWGGPASGGGIGDNAVTLTTANISNNAITKDKIQDGSIVSDKIENGAINADKLSNQCVTTNKIQNHSISSIKIEDDAITGFKIAPDAISSEHISNNCVTTNKIQNSSITNIKIANHAVSAINLANDAVTSVKIKDGAIYNSKIANNAVTGTKIANNSVSTEHLDNQCITNEKIADNVITKDKLTNEVKKCLLNVVTDWPTYSSQNTPTGFYFKIGEGIRYYYVPPGGGCQLSYEKITSDGTNCVN